MSEQDHSHPRKKVLMETGDDSVGLRRVVRGTLECGPEGLCGVIIFIGYSLCKRHCHWTQVDGRWSSHVKDSCGNQYNHTWTVL